MEDYFSPNLGILSVEQAVVYTSVVLYCCLFNILIFVDPRPSTADLS